MARPNKTEKVLLNYMIPDIKNEIIDYAFKCKYKKELFSLGYYEECIKVLEKIEKYDLSRELKLALYDTLFKYAYIGAYVNILALVESSYIGPINKYTKPKCIILVLGGIDKSIINLQDAISNGNVKLTELILPLVMSSSNVSESMFDGIMGNACRSDNLHMVTFIMSHFKDVCKKIFDKWSHLYFIDACIGGNVEIFNFISNIVHTYYWPNFVTIPIIIEHVCEYGNIEILEILLDKQRWHPVLFSILQI